MGLADDDELITSKSQNWEQGSSWHLPWAVLPASEHQGPAGGSLHGCCPSGQEKGCPWGEAVGETGGEGRLSKLDAFSVLFTDVLGSRGIFSSIHSRVLAQTLLTRALFALYTGTGPTCMLLSHVDRGPTGCQTGHFVGTV